MSQSIGSVSGIGHSSTEVTQVEVDRVEVEQVAGDRIEMNCVEVNVEDCFFRSFIQTHAKENWASGNNSADSFAEPWSELLQFWFSHWLEDLHLTLAPVYELSIRLTDNAEIQALNAQYRNKDQPTDVLAFAALEVDSPQIEEIDEPLYLGDIIISVETAQVQAEQQGHSLRQELAWLAAHALLHLLGWDHPTEDELLAMLQKQSWLLAQVEVEVPEWQVEKITD
jgi:probable rRNA maturation factor